MDLFLTGLECSLHRLNDKHTLSHEEAFMLMEETKVLEQAALPQTPMEFANVLTHYSETIHRRHMIWLNNIACRLRKMEDKGAWVYVYFSKLCVPASIQLAFVP